MPQWIKSELLLDDLVERVTDEVEGLVQIDVGVGNGQSMPILSGLTVAAIGNGNAFANGATLPRGSAVQAPVGTV